MGKKTLNQTSEWIQRQSKKALPGTHFRLKWLSRAGCGVRLSSAPALTHSPPSCPCTLWQSIQYQQELLVQSSSASDFIMSHQASAVLRAPSHCHSLLANRFTLPLGEGKVREERPSLLKALWVFPSSLCSQLQDRNTTCHLGPE